ncbi:MAG: hypothetical protein HC840_01310 [Leptolyngbyaceae cyanobacterium RM2_2_4]|nr:hypothetical protein [Leptolyngbyaceae cyanobacterium RM2_2_4]
MNMRSKPMLALDVQKVKDINLHDYLASGKIDGFRATVQLNDKLEPEVYTRSLKVFPNEFVRKTLARSEFLWFDGEIVVGENFHQASSELRQRNGEPRFIFHVFDLIVPQVPLETRLEDLNYRMQNLPYHLKNRDKWEVQMLPHCRSLVNEDGLASITSLYVSLGFEGVCFRKLGSNYLSGRATVNNPVLLKHKEWTISVAKIVDVLFLKHNRNKPYINEVGATKRSTHAENMEEDETMLGSFVVIADNFTDFFSIGSGLTYAQRIEIMKHRESLLGRSVVFKYCPYGSTERAPRHPVFIGLTK